MKKFTFLILLFYLSRVLNAQTPASDNNWTYSWGEDFNYNNFSAMMVADKWSCTGPYGFPCDWNYWQMDNGDNHIFNDTSVKCRLTQDLSMAPFYCGGLKQKYYKWSGLYPVNTNVGGQDFKEFKYGYIDIKFRVTDYSSYPAGAGHAQFVGQAFWLYGEDPASCARWSEIDLLETYGYNGFFPNVHYGRSKNCTTPIREDYCRFDQFNHEMAEWGNCSNHPPIKDPWGISVTNPNNVNANVKFNNSSWHTIGCEWTPDFVNFYFDEVFISSVSVFNLCSEAALGGSIYFKPSDLVPMTLRIEGGFDTSYASVTTFPYDFELDYVKYYTLTMDCSTTVVISTPGYISSYDPKVKKNITVGSGSSNSPVKPVTSQSTSFRAAEWILFNEGFEVEPGAEFFATVSGCQ